MFSHFPITRFFTFFGKMITVFFFRRKTMADTTTSVARKTITLVRNGMEKRILIDRTDSSEAIRDTIRFTFCLPGNSRPVLKDINTNAFLGDLQAVHFWSNPDPNSRYRVGILEDQQSKVHWFRRLGRQVLLPFFGKSCSQICMQKFRLIIIQIKLYFSCE